MLEDTFEYLGLGQNETETYLRLLETGPTTAGDLAKKIGVPRASLYGFLSKLTQKGLVRQSEKAGVKLWQAEAPERILKLLNHQHRQTENIISSFEGILSELRAKQILDYVAPKFSLFEGVDGVRRILEDVLLYRDIVTQCFWPASQMMDILGNEYMAEHNRRRIRQNLYIQSIWPANRTVDVSKHPFLGVGDAFRREIRIPPQGVDCSMGYWAYDNKVGFISSRKESFGFIVESVELRQLLKTQFDVLWSMSKPLSVDSKYTSKFLKEL